MNKYVSIPHLMRKSRSEYIPDYGDEYLHLPTLAVFEDDDPHETGLVDKRGNLIYRVRDRGRPGF